MKKKLLCKIEENLNYKLKVEWRVLRNLILGTNKAFRAPVYSSYMECIKGLFNQGFLGFYKGNMVGIGHTCMTSYFKFHTYDMLDFEDYKFHH